MRRLYAVLLLLILPAFAQKKAEPAKPAWLPSEATVNAFMRHMFGWDSSLNWAVAEIKPSEVPGVAEVIVAVGGPQNRTHFFVSADGKHAFVGDLIPFGADPFKAARDVLAVKAKGPARGPADAAVTIVEFGDLQCPHCKAAQPTVERLLAEVPNARLVFEEFPLPMHDWATKAAEFAECVHQEKAEAFWRFVEGVYGDQENIMADNADQRLRALASASGVNADKVAECAASPAAFMRVNSSSELAKSVGVTGTPTLFVNGRMVTDLRDFDKLKAIVEFDARMAPQKHPAR